MQLIKSWHESLMIFKPANFKVLLGETFSCAARTYVTMFRYFWWLLLICIAVAHYFPHSLEIHPGKPLLAYSPNYLINLVLELFFVFTIILIVHHSSKKVNYEYFISKLGFFIPYAGWHIILYSFFLLMVRTHGRFSGPLGILIGAIFYSINGALAGIVFTSLLIEQIWFYIDANIFFDMVIASSMTFWLFPLSLFFTFFLLDVKIKPKLMVLSIIRAIKMVWYNFPFCLIIHLVFVFVFAFCNCAVRYLAYRNLMITHNLGIILLAPLPICLFSIFYNKRIKEQKKIYFKESPSMWE